MDNKLISFGNNNTNMQRNRYNPYAILFHLMILWLFVIMRRYYVELLVNAVIIKPEE